MVKEYHSIEGLSPGAFEACKKIADNPPRVKGKKRHVLRRQGDKIKARNYVGIFQAADMVIEIFPKMMLSDGSDEGERKTFWDMLCRYRSMNKMARMSQTDIGKFKEYDMLEVFKHVFLQDLLTLVKKGIVSQYHEDEDNLPYMKGRLYFPQHIRQNIANKARFYVRYDEYSPNHAANRLIRRVLQKMRCKERKNRQLRGQLEASFESAPPSQNIQRDWQHWQQHRSNRNTLHYRAVMSWVEVFLSFYGLTTFRAPNTAFITSLLFPMEDVFEDFVSHHFSENKAGWKIHLQGKGNIKYVLTDEKTQKPMFALKPDIIAEHKSNGRKIILDTKWKRMDGNDAKKNYNISPSDIYQLFAYGKFHKCKAVMLIYPRNENFPEPRTFSFRDGSEKKLICYPFDVANPEKSVADILQICGEY